MTPPEVDWPAVIPNTILLDLSMVAPRDVARLDNYGARIRDSLDELGITIADEGQAYCALAGQWHFLRLLAQALAEGQLPLAAWTAAVQVYRGEVAALLPSLPPGARYTG